MGDPYRSCELTRVRPPAPTGQMVESINTTIGRCCRAKDQNDLAKVSSLPPHPRPHLHTTHYTLHTTHTHAHTLHTRTRTRTCVLAGGAEIASAAPLRSWRPLCCAAPPAACTSCADGTSAAPLAAALLRQLLALLVLTGPPLVWPPGRGPRRGPGWLGFSGRATKLSWR